MPASTTIQQQEVRDRFFKLSYEAHAANLKALDKSKTLFEGAMAEINRLNDIIASMEITIIDKNEEIEEQVKIIVKQRDEITAGIRSQPDPQE